VPGGEAGDDPRDQRLVACVPVVLLGVELRVAHQDPAEVAGAQAAQHRRGARAGELRADAAHGGDEPGPGGRVERLQLGADLLG
jgi:hypothetical protein